MKQELLQKFLKSKIKIKSEEKLIEYIDYCLVNSIEDKIKFKSSLHHILPKAKDCFPKYINENKYQVHLLHKHHYYAHYILTEAIETYSQHSAFCAMNNKDINNRITKSDLIPLDEFQIIQEQKGKLFAIAMKDEYINSDGKVTTKSKDIGKKSKSTKAKEYLHNGEITSIDKETGKKRSKKRRKEGNHYNLFHINNGLILKDVDEVDIRQMNQSLLKTDKINYLGKSRLSKICLNRTNKLNMIGLYIVKI